MDIVDGLIVRRRHRLRDTAGKSPVLARRTEATATPKVVIQRITRCRGKADLASTPIQYEIPSTRS